MPEECGEGRAGTRGGGGGVKLERTSPRCTYRYLVKIEHFGRKPYVVTARQGTVRLSSITELHKSRQRLFMSPGAVPMQQGPLENGF